MKYSPIHIIPQTDEPTPAFIHIDMDNLWAIAECYGIKITNHLAHHVCNDALPRFAKLFAELGIRATFFVVGRDLENPHYVQSLKNLIASGHQIANHSYSHSLRFRALSPPAMAHEIDHAHHLITTQLGITPTGFRAPGYGWSRQLLPLLEQRGYRYDSSLMPSPYGSLFRWMDGRIQRQFSSPPYPEKTQYPLLSDTWHTLHPALSTTGKLVQIPAATSGLLRLPFQAGVCMRLGYPYFRACLQPYKLNHALPFVFLFHAADLADFTGIDLPLVQQSSFFNKPIQHRYNLALRFVETIKRYRPVTTTEQWLQPA